jgi:hypothetical protein
MKLSITGKKGDLLVEINRGDHMGRFDCNSIGFYTTVIKSYHIRHR